MIPDGVCDILEMAHVNACLRGGLHCMSIYLMEGEGLGPSSMAILKCAAIALRALNAPWIMTGDWNVPLSAIQEPAWLKIAKGSVYATQLTTCNVHVPPSPQAMLNASPKRIPMNS